MDKKTFLPSIFGDTELYAFRSLQKEIDRVFAEFGRGMPAAMWPSNSTMGTMGLALDVADTPTAIEVTADLPGVDEKDVELMLTGDVLTIRGEKQPKRDEKTKDYRLSERSHGAFERSLHLPFKADASKVQAKFEKGVLKVTVAKPAEAQVASQKIPVKSAA